MLVMDYLLIFIFVLSSFLILYHHLGYPLLLKYLEKRNNKEKNILKASSSERFPTITIVIPAYNEAQWIADKIRNCAMLEYPRAHLKIQIHCDGCTDNTADIARQTIQEMICADTLFEIIEHKTNTGKVSIINKAMKNVTSELTVLTDTSSFISIDALLIAKTHFCNEKIGVVNGRYVILDATSEAEKTYWLYQNQLKSAEAKMATTIGSNGAFYMIRTSLFEPLNAKTINDDFILPMKIVKQGFLSIYDANLIVTELESTPIQADFARRIRISAGNMQQVIFLAGLFNPRFKYIAFAFASGKGLRLLAPYLFIIVFASSFFLRHFVIFKYVFFAQLMLYIFIGITAIYTPPLRFKPIRWLHYLLVGHTANFIGGIKYLLTKSA